VASGWTANNRSSGQLAMSGVLNLSCHQITLDREKDVRRIYRTINSSHVNVIDGDLFLNALPAISKPAQ